jgi:hypothetical protein
MSLEIYLEDLQNHISQDLANSEVCALEHTFYDRVQLCPSDAEVHARVRSIALAIKRTYLTWQRSNPKFSL